MSASVDPFLRWAGSKRQLGATLRRYAPLGDYRYVEPFCGSASLFFALRPTRALLADINPGVIGTFEAVKSSPDAVHAALQEWAVTETQYYHVRSLPDASLDVAGRAARMIYLMRYCYGGIYRTNANGRFNVPYGGGRTGVLPTLDQLRSTSLSLENTTLVAGDFEEVLDREAQKGDFVYLDPPYASSTARKSLQYGPASFAVGDLERAAGLLERLNARGCSFVLSYSDTPEAVETFSRWPVERVCVRRLVAANADRRVQAQELIVSNRRSFLHREEPAECA